MDFKERIRKLRGKMSQAEFSQLIGINPNTLRNYEQGQSLPNIATAADLCEKADVSAEWLLFGEGPMKRGERADTQAISGDQACPNCARLQAELTEERRQNRDLVNENRQLWKENGDLRVEVAELKARAAPRDETSEDARRSA